MSLAYHGSTAPAITSPLLAWPSKPANRSPLSTPSSETFPSSSSSYPSLSHGSESSSTLHGSSVSEWDGQGKGKGRAVSNPMDEDDQRNYGPPKKPLTPRQLGRIAQSFGIVIPSLPLPSPINSPSLHASPPPPRRPSGSNATLVYSPYLLTVVPPLNLLSVKGGSAEDADKRTKKWKRGRLLPLQPTLGGMLLAIAREYGLPSTKGLQLYMTNREDRSSTSSNLSIRSFDEATGPLISPHTWSTLFGQYISASVSRSSTPSATPLKSTGPLGKDIAYPSSPLALLARKDATTPLRQPFSADTSLSSSQSSLPVTPRSALPTVTNPIIGSIEFDVDEDDATWFEEFRKSSHRRKSSSARSSDGGIKELRLVRKIHRAKGRDADLSFETSGGRSSDGSRLLPYDRTPSEGELGNIFPSATEAFKTLQQAKKQSSGQTLAIAQGNTAMSSAGSMGNFAEDSETTGEFDITVEYDSQDNSQEHDDEGSSNLEHEGDVSHHMRELEGSLGAPGGEDSLASAIDLKDEKDLTLDQQVVLETIKAEMDKRGSAMVMSDQLDDLEKLMRTLSPRDIRLTSPRMLTPRMAAKVAHVQFPQNPSLKPKTASLPARSPLAESFQPEPTSAPPPRQPSPEESIENDIEDSDLPVPTWPAVPFSKLPGSPSSAGSIHEFFRDVPPKLEGSPTISEETLSRSKLASPPRPSDWRPVRPVRPASPNLASNKMLPQILDSEVVNVIRSPGRDLDDTERRIRKSPSISLKGLRQISGKGWRKKEDPPIEPLGLFKGNVSPSSTTFPGLKERSHTSTGAPTSEFGTIDELAVPPSITLSGSLPTKAAGGIGRFFGSFGRRPSESPRIPGAPLKSHKARNLSIESVSPVISSPIPDSFVHHNPIVLPANPRESTSTNATIPRSTTATTLPTSPPRNGSTSTGVNHPVSPKSIKRKPVPGSVDGNGNGNGGEEGLKGSMSIGSVASFVLEDPPKRKVPRGVAV